MRASAVAQPNIALIKYWGKRDIERNLPAVGSISITLQDLFTEMQVEFDPDLGADTLVLNGSVAEAMLPRLSGCLDRIVGPDRPRASIVSRCNFPVAAGLASSASAFAAITVAAARAAGRVLDTAELANLAGRSSGSGPFADRVAVRGRQGIQLALVLGSPRIGNHPTVQIRRSTTGTRRRKTRPRRPHNDAWRLD